MKMNRIEEVEKNKTLYGSMIRLNGTIRSMTIYA